MKKLVLIGATSEIAKAFLMKWANKEKKGLVDLVGRDGDALGLLKKDINQSYPNIKVNVYQIDMCNEESINKVIDHIDSEAAIDLAIIAHGVLIKSVNSVNTETLMDISRAMNVNALSPILFSEKIIASMIKKGFGKLIILGSVAGDRGRKSNYLYGSAKAMLESYVSGLDHRLFQYKNVTCQILKLGPVDTRMTKGMILRGAATKDEVANAMISNLTNDSKSLYIPKKWLYIMFIIKIMPNFIFKRLEL